MADRRVTRPGDPAAPAAPAPAPAPAPAVQSAAPVAGAAGARVAWMLVAALLIAVAVLAWRAFQADGDPVGSAMLAFEKQDALTVFSSRFEIAADSADARTILGVPVLRSRQMMIVPAQVEYRIDLSHMGRDRFVWNPATHALAVRLPPLRTSAPNIDEGHARVFQDGLFITRTASMELNRKASRDAARKASAFARNPQIMAMARGAARDAVRQNLAIPLQVAGYADAAVTVTFDGERTT